MADAPGYPGLEAPLDRRRGRLRPDARSIAQAWPEHLLRLVLVVGVAVVVAGAGWAWSSGWRVLVITTPSMRK